MLPGDSRLDINRLYPPGVVPREFDTQIGMKEVCALWQRDEPISWYELSSVHK